MNAWPARGLGMLSSYQQAEALMMNCLPVTARESAPVMVIFFPPPLLNQRRVADGRPCSRIA